MVAIITTDIVETKPTKKLIQLCIHINGITTTSVLYENTEAWQEKLLTAKRLIDSLGEGHHE